MNPSSIGKQESQQREAQKKQVVALIASTEARLKVRKESREHLDNAIKKIDSIGTIPSISDFRKIADAIKHMAMADLAPTIVDIADLEAQALTLNDALKSVDSRVIPVHINKG